MGEERFKVRSAAYVLNCTPDLIYSYFKDRNDPVEGGLTEEQLCRIYKHVNGGNRKRPFKNKVDDVARVQLYIQKNLQDQQFLVLKAGEKDA